MVNFPTSLDAFTNPVGGTDRQNSATVPHATQHANLNDAVEALEAKVGIDGSVDTDSLDYKVSQKQAACEVKDTSFTAINGGRYNCVATLTITDPSPVEGQGFEVFVRNGTITVGGTAYTVPGTEVCRIYHSGAWSNFVKYPVSGGEGSSTQVLTSNGAGNAPSFQAASAGGVKQIRIRIPGQLVADANIHQGVFWYNDTGSSVTISNVAFLLGSTPGTSVSFNVYKSSGTASNGVDTSATNLFSSAVTVSNGSYYSATNVPNTTTVESGRWVSLRCTATSGTAPIDMECVITY